MKPSEKNYHSFRENIPWVIIVWVSFAAPAYFIAKLPKLSTVHSISQVQINKINKESK